MQIKKYGVNIALGRRGVAQPGRALGLGPRCRVFESRRPDHKTKKAVFMPLFFVLKYEVLIRTRELSVFDYKRKAGVRMPVATANERSGGAQRNKM